MKKLWIRLGFIFVAACLLVFNGKGLRESKKSSVTILPNNLPPSMQVAGVALGPLKGLLVDILWWRSERLMDNKEFFEAIQLADWITSLQPTYPSVWSYQGFNFAFNISHNFSDFDERWNWIYEGIKLLRNKGLKYNPDWDKNRDIRFELVHIFYRKVEGVSDKESKRFQDLWTLEMLKYFNNGNRKELEVLARSPKTFEELFKKPEIKLLAEQYKAQDRDLRTEIEARPPTYSQLKPNTRENFQYNKAIVGIIDFLRRRAIETDLNMDVDRMLNTDIEYGPLDWRTHHAQIIYWGAVKSYDEFLLNTVNFSEYIRAAMLSSFYNGKVGFSEKKDYFIRSHNIEILPKLHKFFDFLLYKSGLDEESKEFKRVDKIHKDFLERAIVITYTYNQIEASRELFEHYELYLPDNHNVTFEQYVMEGFNRSLKIENTTARRSFLEATFFKAFQDAARGDWDRYHGQLKIIKMIHTYHQKKNRDIPSKLLPPLKDIAKAAKKSYLKSTGKDEGHFSKLESQADKFRTPKKKLTSH